MASDVTPALRTVVTEALREIQKAVDQQVVEKKALESQLATVNANLSSCQDVCEDLQKFLDNNPGPTRDDV